jgi:hypothetical protein
MKVLKTYSALAMLMLCGVIMRCDNSTPNNPLIDPMLNHVILKEGFEGDLSNYKQMTYRTGVDGMMGISKLNFHTGSGSLTSDSNNTGARCMLEEQIDDSIAGLQFFMMATKKSHANTIVGIYKMGSSANGIFTILAMGFDKSDSLKYIYENVPGGNTGDEINEYRNFAPLETNKWYKFKVEYNYTDTTFTFSLNDEIVRQRNAPNPMTLQHFCAMRDGLGAQGPSGYYIDDIIVYKR